jgi:hypothetical protein
MQGYHFGRPVAAADCPLDACFLLDLAEDGIAEVA